MVKLLMSGAVMFRYSVSHHVEQRFRLVNHPGMFQHLAGI